MAFGIDDIAMGVGALMGIKNLFGGGGSKVPQAPTVPTLPVGGTLTNTLPYLQRFAMRPVTSGLGLQAGNTYQEQMNRLIGSLRASGLRGSTGTTSGLAQGAGALAGSLEGVAGQQEQMRQEALMRFAQLLHGIVTGNQQIPFQNYNAALNQYGAEQGAQQTQLDAIKELAALWAQYRAQQAGGGAAGTYSNPYNGTDWVYDSQTGKMLPRGG